MARLGSSPHSVPTLCRTRTSRFQRRSRPIHHHARSRSSLCLRRSGVRISNLGRRAETNPGKGSEPVEVTRPNLAGKFLRSSLAQRRKHGPKMELHPRKCSSCWPRRSSRRLALPRRNRLHRSGVATALWAVLLPQLIRRPTSRGNLPTATAAPQELRNPSGNARDNSRASNRSRPSRNSAATTRA
jgi:hypothetical protein